MATKLRPSAKEFVPVSSKIKLRAQAPEFVPSPTSTAPSRPLLNGVGSKNAKKSKENKEDFTQKHPSALKIEDPSEAKDFPSPVEDDSSFSIPMRGKIGQSKSKTPIGLTADGDEEEEEGKEEEEDEELSSKPFRKQSMEEETKAEQSLENSIKKSTYTREFILNLRDHASSPREKEIMDQIAKVLGKAATASPRPPARGRGIDPRARGGRVQRGGKGTSSRRGGGGRSRRPESPMDIEVKDLEKTDKRYVIQKDVPPDQKLIRSVTSILNKLTPEKFDRLLKQVLELKIDTAERLRDTVTAVFEKALAEPDFSPIYAEFALHLSKKLAGYEVGKETLTFKRLLLNHCQSEFEKETPPSPGTTDPDDEEGDGVISKKKRRMLATIRFIGELYARKMLSSSIIQYCITMLLGKADSPEEMKLDALCKLLATIGKVYDSEKNKTFLDATFDTLRDLSTNRHALSSRSRFKIQDTLDLREDSWVDRKHTLSQKKLSEIRKEASQKEEPDNARRGRFSATASPRKTPKTPIRSPVVKNPEDEWETVGGGKGKRGRQDVRFDSRRSNFSPKTPSTALRDTPKSKSNGRDLQKSTPKAASKPTPLAPGERPKVSAGMRNAFDLLDDDDEPKESKKKKSTKKPSGKKTDDLEVEVSSEKYRKSHEKLFSSAQDKSETESRSSKTTEEDDSELGDGEREKLESKARGLLEEFWSTQDLAEATESVAELPSKGVPLLVSQGLILASDKKDQERDLLSQLFVHLYQQKKLSKQSIEEGFREVLDLGEDLIIDIPYLYDHMGDILGKLIANEAMSLNFITLDLLTSAQVGSRKKFIGHVLTTLKNEGGEDRLQTLYKASGLDLEQLLEDDPESFLEDQELSFLTS